MHTPTSLHNYIHVALIASGKWLDHSRSSLSPAKFLLVPVAVVLWNRGTASSQRLQPDSLDHGSWLGAYVSVVLFAV
jgi:hypothetical protein